MAGEYCLKAKAHEMKDRYSRDGLGSKANSVQNGTVVLLDKTKCPSCPYHASIEVVVVDGRLRSIVLNQEGSCVNEN